MSDTTQLKFRGTKGNWGIFPTPNDDDFSHEITAPGTSIGVIRQFNDDITEETANAHLIAAAPDLLAAAIRMVDACCGDQRDEYELQKGLGTPVYTAMLQLTAAINKALNYE